MFFHYLQTLPPPPANRWRVTNGLNKPQTQKTNSRGEGETISKPEQTKPKRKTSNVHEQDKREKKQAMKIKKQIKIHLQNHNQAVAAATACVSRAAPARASVFRARRAQ